MRVVALFAIFLMSPAFAGESSLFRLPAVEPQMEFGSPVADYAGVESQPFALSSTPAPSAGETERFHLPPPPGWTEEEFGFAKPLPRLSDHKNGFFQKFAVHSNWLGGDATNGLGIVENDLSLAVAVPLPTRDWPLLITPGFRARAFNGPVAPDLPGAVYDAYLDLLWVPKLSDRWTAIIGVGPGYFSDFQHYDSDAIRVIGKGLVRWDWIPGKLQLIAGLLYLDRDDISTLPAGGLIWMPNDHVHYQIVFPRSKLAHRFGAGDGYEHWAYLKGEFGGDTWSIQRASGEQDRVTLRDLRFIVGCERKHEGGAGFFAEIGYVFARTIQYRSAETEFDIPATVMVRGGVSF